MNPLATVLLLAAGSFAISSLMFVVGGVWLSVVRLWPIIPMLYTLIFAAGARFANPRIDVMGLLVFLWGVRLTFQFVRRGGYSGRNASRLADERERIFPHRFSWFAPLAICAITNAILLAITLPAYTALEHRAAPFGGADAALTFAFLLCLVGETVADQQKWVFHEEMEQAEVTSTARPVSPGLWRYLRHPNFIFGAAQWWILFFFGAVAAGSAAQWTIVGAFALTGQFVALSALSASRDAERAEDHESRKRYSPAILKPSRRVQRSRD